ncbi:hypothetical protein [Candidatus Enterococcus mansonii]|uniref:Uncharacterized protein n=1 Tax=Candidatus Enterococcus mansonii TaxID=1834181 RepID=A0A242CEZ5_9ENTE|nr:hypothetical protein [Enterococcus sp. 4G2_DIV0659]OTO08490.1 hypothetical protein A5880_001490 [Enterococcus sp. 4G2_DIV0659]
MSIITTIEEFWEVIDEIRIERELNWSDIAGSNAKLAASKKWNPTLACIFKMQKKLDINLMNTIAYDVLESASFVNKDPESPKKMELIYQWIQSEHWMEDEETVQKVQELATTII